MRKLKLSIEGTLERYNTVNFGPLLALTVTRVLVIPSKCNRLKL